MDILQSFTSQLELFSNMNIMPQSGTSPFPPLSAERIAAAREQHGNAVDQYLAHLCLGDPLADELILCFEKLPPGEGTGLLTKAIEDGIDAIENPPAPLVALFEQLDHIPVWVDWDRMLVASEKIIQAGLLAALSFGAYALPYSYLATANKPLAFTRALLDKTVQRYARTMRFVLETFMPHGLQRSADGFKIAVLIRVAHARIRRQILQSGAWGNKSTPELPLNQAHMAMSLIYFGFYTIKGMKQLGVRLTRREEESVILTWRYVGHLFGINPEMVCTTEEEVHRMLEIGFSLEYDPDDTSRRLCRALMESSSLLMKIDSERWARFFLRMAYPMSRHLLGDHLADQLGYPKQKRRLLCYGFISLVWLSERVPWLVPRKVREYKGVAFWLDRADYDMPMFD